MSEFCNDFKLRPTNHITNFLFQAGVKYIKKAALRDAYPENVKNIRLCNIIRGAWIRTIFCPQNSVVLKECQI